MTNITGRKVRLVFTRNNVFDWQDNDLGCTFEAICVYTPCATGDLWRFKVGEVEIALNPQCSDFVGFEFWPEEEQ